LTPNGNYRLILYSAANPPGHKTIFTVNGSSETVADPNSIPTLQNGLTYADFTATTADAKGDLSFTVSFPDTGADSDEGDINGFQLQSLSLTAAVPEPASLILAGIVAAGLAGYGWGRRR
jgi:hypothetical protein